MNRTLRRPMFRRGGSANSGITSGLDKPRQEYRNAGMAELVKQTRNSLTPEVLAAYQPQEQIQNYANIVTGIMGGMAGQGSTQTQVPNPSPLQTALGAAATGAGIYGALK